MTVPLNNASDSCGRQPLGGGSVVLFRMLVCLVCSLGGAYGTVALAARDEVEREAGAQTNRVFTTSASGRFVVCGTDVVSNMVTTRRAEVTAARLERLLGVKFPFHRAEVIEIRQAEGSEATLAPSLVARVDGGLFRRVLTIHAAIPPDPEVLDERLCRALVIGYIREKRARRDIPVIPEWLTMGLAQNLTAESRERSRVVLTGWREHSSVFPLADVFRWQTLPDGWPRQRSFCGLAVHWIGTLGDAGSPYARILDRLVEDGAVTSAWMAGTFMPGAAEPELESAWRDWLGRQAALLYSFGGISSSQIDHLRDELPLEVWAGSGGDEPLWMTPREAIGRRRETGVSFAAMQKAQRLRALTIGKARELAGLGEDFARFYEHVAAGGWSVTLNRELSRAEEKLIHLGDLTRKREAWLDDVEREMTRAEEGSAKNTPGREPVLEKGRLERYVDEAEQKFRQTP